MSEVVYITQEGYEKLRKELDYLRSVERPSISRLIAEARDKGDLSENAEYTAAREAQGLLEIKIGKLENTLLNSRVIDESRVDTFTVQLLNRVKMKNTLTNAVVEYTLVPESEADLKAGKMSVNTPIARGLLGKKVGDVVHIKVPSGQMVFEILEIAI
jgi:transcription elongation factor GreA